jgi:pimeloyl-ACP methyl ester carboxylesterase
MTCDAAHMQTSRTMEILTAIWGRVLPQPQIGAEENFFDLGGDPASANRLFFEIAEEFGRELSPLTIYHAPTIAALARVLDEPALPRFPTIVQLKAGGETVPVYMVPGLCSSVMEFFKLVKHIETPRRIYGMQPRGLDALEEPFERVEDLAQFYIDAIQVQQPIGPYIFVGYSFGGLVALEMAQRLSEKGQKVGLLAMIETFPHRNHVPLGQSAGIFVRRVKRLVSKILCRAGLQKPAPEDPGEKKPDLPEVGKEFQPVMRRACLKGFVAFEHYRPRYYKGRINFVRATTRLHALPDDPNVVWRRLVDEFFVEIALGGHWGIVTTQFKSTAAMLSRYLESIPE